MSDEAWYEALRAEYRPTEVRVLLLGESPPDPRNGDRRFFYAPNLKIDNLYRGVAQALYGLDDDFDVRAKTKILRRLQGDGIWLIDAVETPVNAHTIAERRRAIRAGVPRLIERCTTINPTVGVIICHSVVYREVAPSLRLADIIVMHDEPLPFPLGNTRARFVEGARAALGPND